MHWALLVMPSGLPPRDPILNGFAYLLWASFLPDSELRCLAVLAKPYPLSGPAYMPQNANLLHCMSQGVHQVLETNSLARSMSVFHINISCLSICD